MESCLLRSISILLKEYSIVLLTNIPIGKCQRFSREKTGKIAIVWHGENSWKFPNNPIINQHRSSFGEQFINEARSIHKFAMETNVISSSLPFSDAVKTNRSSRRKLENINFPEMFIFPVTKQINDGFGNKFSRKKKRKQIFHKNSI